jgi:hypothetical protein
MGRNYRLASMVKIARLPGARTTPAQHSERVPVVLCVRDPLQVSNRVVVSDPVLVVHLGLALNRWQESRRNQTMD